MNWAIKIISKTLMTKISHISWGGYDNCFYGINTTVGENVIALCEVLNWMQIKLKWNNKTKITIFMMILMISGAIASTCPGGLTNLLSIKRQQDNFTGGSNITLAWAKIGPISKCIYYMYNFNGSKTVI